MGREERMGGVNGGERGGRVSLVEARKGRKGRKEVGKKKEGTEHGTEPGRGFKRRFPKEMATDTLRLEHWRKSSQWFALMREHAKLVVEDTHVSAQFKKCALPALLLPSSCSPPFQALVLG